MITAGVVSFVFIATTFSGVFVVMAVPVLGRPFTTCAITRAQWTTISALITSRVEEKAVPASDSGMQRKPAVRQEVVIRSHDKSSTIGQRLPIFPSCILMM
jgi:hypothetical protein